MVVSVPYSGEGDRGTAFWWQFLLAPVHSEQHGTEQVCGLWPLSFQTCYNSGPTHGRFLSGACGKTFQYTSNGESLKEKSQLAYTWDTKHLLENNKSHKRLTHERYFYALQILLRLAKPKKINGFCSVFNSPSWFYHSIFWLLWTFLITFDLEFGLRKNKVLDDLPPFYRWHSCCQLRYWDSAYFGFLTFALISFAVDFSFASSFKLAVLRYDNSS